MSEEYIAGRKPVMEALRAGSPLNKLYVAAGNRRGLEDLLSLAHARRIPVSEVTPAVLDKMAPDSGHQGVVAAMAARAYATLDQILAVAAEKGESPFILMLDGLEDPRNLGAIIRTAEAAAAHGVIIPERRSVGLTPAAVKTSAGASEYLPVARVTNLNRTIEELKEKGLWIIGADMNGPDYRTVDFAGAVCLVIGSEGKGLSRMVREHCDFLAAIPMRGQVGSLNASVAAGLLIYEVLRKRDARKSAGQG